MQTNEVILAVALPDGGDDAPDDDPATKKNIQMKTQIVVHSG